MNAVYLALCSCYDGSVPSPVPNTSVNRNPVQGDTASPPAPERRGRDPEESVTGSKRKQAAKKKRTIAAAATGSERRKRNRAAEDSESAEPEVDPEEDNHV